MGIQKQLFLLQFDSLSFSNLHLPVVKLDSRMRVPLALASSLPPVSCLSCLPTAPRPPLAPKQRAQRAKFPSLGEFADGACGAEVHGVALTDRYDIGTSETAARPSSRGVAPDHNARCRVGSHRVSCRLAPCRARARDASACRTVSLVSVGDHIWYGYASHRSLYIHHSLCISSKSGDHGNCIRYAELHRLL